MGDWLETGAAFGGDGANRLAADPRSRIRAGDLGRAVHRRSRVAIIQGASRLVRQGRRRPAVACRSSDIRGLAPWPLVCPRRHASRRAGAPRARLQDDARRVGLHVFQARRQLLGRHSRRPLPRSARHAHRSLSPRHGGGAARHPRRVRPRLQPSDLAVDRRHSRLAQLARHSSRLEARQRHRAAEPEPQLAERPLVVERSRCDRADRRAQRRRVPVSRHRDLRERRDDPVRRRSHDDHARAAGDAEEAAAAHGPGRPVCRHGDASGRRRSRRRPAGLLPVQLGRCSARAERVTLSRAHRVRELWTRRGPRHAHAVASRSRCRRTAARCLLCDSSA